MRVAQGSVTRRCAVSFAAALPFAALSGSCSAAEKPTEAALLAELVAVREALKPLPELLDQEKWDEVRAVLKKPPTATLWNLGEAKNPMRKLADLRDDVELFELADEISGALQLADQFTYDNNFIYFQPGNGKVKIKEPKQQIKIAGEKLTQMIGS